MTKHREQSRTLSGPLALVGVAGLVILPAYAFVCISVIRLIVT